MLLSNKYILLLILFIILILVTYNTKFEFFDQILASSYSSSISSAYDYITSSGLSSSVESLNNLNHLSNDTKTKFDKYVTMINNYNKQIINVNNKDEINPNYLNFNNTYIKYKKIYDDIQTNISDINTPQVNVSQVTG